MTREIKEVVVDKVSLVTKDHTPAVKKAESRFSIFKMFNKKKIDKQKLSKIKNILENKNV